MATAAPALSKMRPEISSWQCMCFLFVIITVATVSEPALVKADLPARPSTLVLYSHIQYVDSNGTAEAGNPLMRNDTQSFGPEAIVYNVVREGQAGDSPVLGESVGEVRVGSSNRLYTTTTFVLDTPGYYAGSIIVQGAAQSGKGELAITGGTGDFRLVKGYVESLRISPEDDANIVYKGTFFLIYD